jgi:hypothetical protein
VDETNNTITCVVAHATTFAVTYPASQVTSSTPSTGGSRRSTIVSSNLGAGGVESVSTEVASDSNTQTTNLSTSLSNTVAAPTDISRSISISSNMVTEQEQTKVAQLTNADGSITLKPNKHSTVSVIIPAEVQVSGTLEWDGKIEPPLIKPVTLIATIGETIEGSSKKLERESVVAIVKVGSSLSTLNFSKDVTMEIPVNLADEVEVRVYYSVDSNLWLPFRNGQVYTAQDGKVLINTNHFTYFALELVDETLVTLHTSSPKEFVDIIGHWAESYINNISSKGIVSGKSKRTFAPNDFITRAELAKIVINAFGFEIPDNVNQSSFSDVPINAWFAPFIYVAKDHKLVEGYPDGEFKPNNFISRVESLKILLKAAGFELDNKATADYKDTEKISWYAKYLAFATSNKIVSGYMDGTFKPGNPITRAEIAKIVVKILEMQ